jgi:hypothetical protein
MQEKLKQQSQKDRSNSPNNSMDANDTDDYKSILDASSLQEGDSFLDSRVLGTQSSEEFDGLRVQISPEKVLNLPYLSQAQTKALTGKTYSPEKVLNLPYLSQAQAKALTGKTYSPEKVLNLPYLSQAPTKGTYR